MLRPVIFIGCGGSGEKAVRYVRDAVRRRLDHSGWSHKMPDSWQFIGLDTLTTQESPTEIPTIPVRDFLTLSAEHDSYGALHRSLVANHSDVLGRPDLLCGWLPNPGQVRIPLKDGAGKNRAIGRAAGLRSLERTLLPRLQEAFKRASSGAQELYEAGKKLGVDAALGSNAPEPLVVVCSSMAGGTGAGVVLDVVDLLRSWDPLGAHPSLVLFANDIFDFAEKQAMAANSLGLMSELLAAYWSEPGEIDSPVSTGMVQNPGVGPHSVFILGKSGYSGANLGSTAEVYQAVGEALATWVTSDTVQERIHNFINVNWRNDARNNYGGYPFGRQHQFGAVSSFGAAKITVGRDRFAQWADDKLAREVLDTLLKGHLRLGGKDNHDSDEERVAELGRKYAETVYRAVPLAGAPPDPVPGCYGAPEHFAPNEQIRAKASQVRREISKNFSSQNSGSGAQWSEQLKTLGRRQSDEIEREAQSARDIDWCQAMVDATCKAASEVAAVSSLPVAAWALTDAAETLNPAEKNRVRADASKADGQYRQRVEEGIKDVALLDGQIKGDDPRLQDATEKIAQGVALQWQSLRLIAAAEVMEHAGEQVLGVMADALRAAAGQVDQSLASDEVKGWPEAGSSGVPKRYLSSTVELPLESDETWEETLAELCMEARVDGISCGTRTTDSLRYRLVAGTPLEADEAIEPLVYRSTLSRWNPSQPANLICRTNKDDISERVRRWTAGGKFQRVVGEGLAAYLAETDPHTGDRRVDHADRLETFRRQLGKAMSQSEPLVIIDSDLYGECHGKPISLTTVCSQFPFQQGHPAENDARDIVGADNYDSSGTDTASVLISQYIGSPIHPLVIRSFTAPLTEATAATGDPGERASSFWMWRRARRLDGFVPLPRPVLESIVRGFAVARLCGYVTADIDRPVRISAHTNEVEFPWPLLSLLSDPNDILAGLLEGFSLTFGTVGGDGFSVYEGYSRLYDLGEPGGDGRLHDDLKAVLANGHPPHPTVANERPKVSGDTPEERQNSARRYLESNMAWFKDQETKRDKSDEGLAHRGADGRAESGVPTMELAELFSKCYGQLHELLRVEGARGSVV